MLQRWPLAAYMVPWTVWLSSVRMNGTTQPEDAKADSAMANRHAQQTPENLIMRIINVNSPSCHDRINPK
jgi:hypothetical protein